ncbi:hypothetical protein OIDMADRAFT_61927 [Oidiodendron maius Zn]|uniref:Uncharacterized protein n=1 Tax=Oidiodendron maius (strain Zn) TaxID=913774 RepID=A0A0C3GAD9_OIDMZ|nr:hypothetical protein OIDMADRAFT_61927 [Oidiodendron maius Zn]
MNRPIDTKDCTTTRQRSTGIDNILRDPFALATILASAFAWLITFLSSAISAAQHDTNPYPNYCWFSVIFMFCLIVGIFMVLVSDTIPTYYVATVGFLSAGLILTSSSVNDLIYTSNGAKEVAAAGFTSLSILSIIWIFYFSSPV